jgi:hypothetical protein
MLQSAMGDEPSVRSEASGLRGWLSDLLFTTLVHGPLAPLVLRLGGRSTIDHPVHGRASGMPDVETLLVTAIGWLADRKAVYERRALVVGTDRDVAEGTLVLAGAGGEGELRLPVAVVAERRKLREVELRVYHATRMLGSEPTKARERLVEKHKGPGAPLLVLDHLQALRAGDAKGVLACFESNGVVHDAAGREHSSSDGSLVGYFAERFGVGEEGGGADFVHGGYADDGRACAVELTLTSVRGKAVAPYPALAVFERGDSGLFRALRLYEDP